MGEFNFTLKNAWCELYIIHLQNNATFLFDGKKDLHKENGQEKRYRRDPDSFVMVTDFFLCRGGDLFFIPRECASLPPCPCVVTTFGTHTVLTGARVSLPLGPCWARLEVEHKNTQIHDFTFSLLKPTKMRCGRPPRRP